MGVLHGPLYVTNLAENSHSRSNACRGSTSARRWILLLGAPKKEERERPPHAHTPFWHRRAGWCGCPRKSSLRPYSPAVNLGTAAASGSTHPMSVGSARTHLSQWRRSTWCSTHAAQCSVLLQHHCTTTTASSPLKNVTKSNQQRSFTSVWTWNCSPGI